MIVEDQSAIVAFLSDAASHGRVQGAVEQTTTHASVIFLAGDRVYKLKRAIRLPYLDYATADLRHRACCAELTLNRRTAPALYLGVQAIGRRADGTLGFDVGEPIDWVVVMRRFDADMLFDAMAARGALTPDLMRETSDVIARFHATAAKKKTSHGGYEGIRKTLEGNAASFAALDRTMLDARRVAALQERSLARAAALAGLLDRRRADGHVRHGHGDLHLRNICLFENRPTLFDCVEFNLDLACVDTLYDLSFLLMDLVHRRLGGLANLVFNRYLDVTGEGGGLAALPLFLSMHAAIRAHVSGAAAQAQPAGVEDDGWSADAATYLDLAVALLEPHHPQLVAIGGLSGSGKSTLAAALAPRLGGALGARVMRSDVLRKRLANRAPEERLPPAFYDRETTQRVYAALGAEAAAALAAGYSVVVDAVFAEPAERRSIAETVRGAGVPFRGLWLEAPVSTMAARIEGRRADASDATVAVLERQRAYALGEIDWRRLDASGGLDSVTSAALASI